MFCFSQQGFAQWPNLNLSAQEGVVVVAAVPRVKSESLVSCIRAVSHWKESLRSLRWTLAKQPQELFWGEQWWKLLEAELSRVLLAISFGSRCCQRSTLEVDMSKVGRQRCCSNCLLGEKTQMTREGGARRKGDVLGSGLALGLMINFIYL